MRIFHVQKYSQNHSFHLSVSEEGNLLVLFLNFEKFMHDLTKENPAGVKVLDNL
ncbi:hypothetical protein V7014_18730 [Bacillus sp. JJ722]